MYAAEFDYVRASSIDEAISIKGENDDSSFLAGGHSLIPAMKLRLSTPQKLIDISGLNQLKNISKNGSYISIGALCTHKQCAESELILSGCPALSDAASVIGDPHVRNKGTIGGALAHSDPQADYPGAVLALNATFFLKDLQVNAQLMQLIISPVFGKLHLERMKFLLKSGFPWTVLMPIHAISSSHNLHPAIHMWAARWLWIIPEEIVLKSELVSAEVLNTLFVTAELKMLSGDRR